MDGSTAAAVETGSFWKTTPAPVRKIKPSTFIRIKFSCGLMSDVVFPTALNVSCGSVDDFECGNGDCINYSLTCDGMAHCKDKSDEKQSYCGEFHHRTNYHL